MKRTLFIIVMLLLSVFVFAEDVEEKIIYAPGEDPASSTSRVPFAVPSTAPFQPGFTCIENVASWHHLIVSSTQSGGNVIGQSCPANSWVKLYKCNQGWNAQSGCVGGSSLFGDFKKVGSTNPKATINANSHYNYGCVPCTNSNQPSGWCDARLYAGTDRNANNCQIPKNQKFSFLDLKVKAPPLIGNVRLGNSFPEGSIAEVTATVLNRGQTGCMYVEAGYNTLSYVTKSQVRPFAAPSSRQVDSCQLEEQRLGFVDTKLVCLDSNAKTDVVLKIKTPSKDSFKETKPVILTQTYLRCWSPKLPGTQDWGNSDIAYKQVNVIFGTVEPTDHCFNTFQDKDETAMNCGGKDCKPCPKGAGCLVDTDCEAETICLTGWKVPQCEKPQPEKPVGDKFCDGNAVAQAWKTRTGGEDIRTEQCEQGLICQNGACVVETPVIPLPVDPEPPFDDCFTNPDLCASIPDPDVCTFGEENCEEPIIDCNDEIYVAGEEVLCGDEDRDNSPECTTDSECAPAGFCNLEDNKCAVLIDDAECRSNFDCGENGLCSVENKCMAKGGNDYGGAIKCTTHAECPKEQVCFGDFGGFGLCTKDFKPKSLIVRLFDVKELGWWTYSILGGVILLSSLGIYLYKRKK